MRFKTAALVATLLVGIASGAQAGPIDLNDFYANGPVTVVDVPRSGYSATLDEGDPAFFETSLNNDPFFLDPWVIIAEAGKTLIFEYVFVEPDPDNVDQFIATLFDPAIGPTFPGLLSFSSLAPGSGTVLFDLSPFAGLDTDDTDGIDPGVLGLSFQLNRLSGDAADDSSVTISDLRIDAVPLPSAAWAGLGLFGVFGLVRLARRQ